uniref:Transcription elongation factor n=1 Tax=Hydra vulgaris TaxID=6087 RepID=A0ABM4D8A7_HYDVU
MPLEHDVLNLSRQLEKLVADGNSNNESASDLLNQLKKLPITLDILQKTRIGMTVNVLRKASDREDVQIIAKSLIKSWKKLLDSQDKVKPKSIPENDSSTVISSNQDIKKPSSNSVATKSYNKNKGDAAVRSQCQQMIASSLKNENNPDYDPTNIAAAIENEIFMCFKDTNIKYRNKIKSKVMNLRDKRNPELCQLVIEGIITPERFAKMTAEEMASDEMKKERKKITEEAIKEHQLATTAGTSTGQFKCGKCGKRNTTYNQVQTRSADEPMTTFVYCIECGNRWKFC